MRRSAVLMAILLTAATAFAEDDTPKATPDYSRDTLIRLFADNPVKEKAEPRVQFGFGVIDFKALGMRWRIGYLPIFQPLQGSQPWRNGDRWPDPFMLTGTEIASPPRTWRQTRNMNAELKRIEKKLKQSQKVTVKPQ